MSKSKQRNWSHYNQRLKQHSRVEVFLSQDVISGWHYRGKRYPGGKLLYSDAIIEACLLIREYFGLGLRQTEGFVQSLSDALALECKVPDYTTLSRRCARLRLTLPLPARGQGLVIAIDSTGLSVHGRHEWNRLKHGREDNYRWHEKWRKLHIAIDTHSGMIVSASYSSASENDGSHLPALLTAIEAPVHAVAADMAYDTLRCRQAIQSKGARQLIPPRRDAILSQENRNRKPYAHILKERDDAISTIRHNATASNLQEARAAWKRTAGYHVRSRIETTMSQIKTHASDRLANRTEANRATQAILKCVLVNRLAAY